LGTRTGKTRERERACEEVINFLWAPAGERERGASVRRSGGAVRTRAKQSEHTTAARAWGAAARTRRQHHEHADAEGQGRNEDVYFSLTARGPDNHGVNDHVYSWFQSLQPNKRIESFYSFNQI